MDPNQLNLKECANESIVSLRAGSFGAIIQDNDLLIPPKLFTIARYNFIGNALELLGFLESFPGIIVVNFGWTVAQTTRAIDKLKKCLKDYIPEDYSVKQPIPKTGAVPPKRGGKK